MKILSDEKELIDWKALTPINDSYTYYDAYGETVAKAQHLDTLRQVREVLDGIENPYPAKIVMRHISPNIVPPPSSAHIGFKEAIQTMKALLEG